MPDLYVIGGPNGAGKTTTATSMFPGLGVAEFVNADSIASGLSPFNPEAQARAAGRLMLQRLDELKNAKQDFAFETTLASKTFASFASECREAGYTFNLIYVWLRSSELALERVARRVRSGGHNIPSDVIVRRYGRGLRNFFELYSPISDSWTVLDNSEPQTILVAQGGFDLTTDVFMPETWEKMKEGFSND